ncbi:MAG: hypothetical protein PF450_16670, partial [Bacteroidales bacterium]|nr:hypothetical protein [Bacteroidales bacterium]
IEPEIEKSEPVDSPTEVEGKAWFIPQDDIDTDMIFHNMHLSITDQSEMGKYAFGNLKGYEKFADEVKPGDIIVVGKNFGSGSSRQQAVDCFKALGVSAIIAESYGSIYERNAINAAFPIMVCENITKVGITNGETLKVDFDSGLIIKSGVGKEVQGLPFSDVQMEIYKNNGLF